MSDEMRPRVAVIIVAYNSSSVIADAIKSVPSGNQVIIVDNASTDGSAAIAKSLGATVIQLEENLGFGTACNRGAAQSAAEFYLFLNPDARLMPDAIDILIDRLSKQTDIGAANPRVCDDKGNQFYKRRNRFLKRHYIVRPPRPEADTQIVMLSGAALFVRAGLFQSIGGFDEKIFLFYEDDDISRRILEAGAKLLYVHDARLIHNPGTGSGTIDHDLTYFKEYHAMQSMLYLLGKYDKPRLLLLRSLQLKWRLLKSPDGSALQTGLRAKLAAIKDWSA